MEWHSLVPRPSCVFQHCTWKTWDGLGTIKARATCVCVSDVCVFMCMCEWVCGFWLVDVSYLAMSCWTLWAKVFGSFISSSEGWYTGRNWFKKWLNVKDECFLYSELLYLNFQRVVELAQCQKETTDPEHGGIYMNIQPCRSEKIWLYKFCYILSKSFQFLRFISRLTGLPKSRFCPIIYRNSKFS